MANRKEITRQFDLSGKVAIVSGGSNGIGEAISRSLAEFGARVIVCSRKQDAVDAVANSIKSNGYDATGVCANIGQQDDIYDLIKKTISIYGGLDILVNNAAANPVFGPIQDTQTSAFDKIMDVNLKGPFELCKAAYPIMKSRGGGSIINISSIGGLRPESGIGIYSVSKAAIINMTKAMAQDWGKDNIRINAICPGLIKTKFSQALWSNEEIHQRFIEKIPLGRVGTPDDIAGLALFLASDASQYCSGGEFVVDGGYSSH